MNLKTLNLDMLKKYRYPITAGLLCSAILVGHTHAQDFTLRYFELRDLFHTPGEVQLSPEYQTVIEFDGLTVERVSSGRTDEIVAEVVDNTIRLRANQYIVNTGPDRDGGGPNGALQTYGQRECRRSQGVPGSK